MPGSPNYRGGFFAPRTIVERSASVFATNSPGPIEMWLRKTKIKQDHRGDVFAVGRTSELDQERRFRIFAVSPFIA
jgi:hypothetical protein